MTLQSKRTLEQIEAEIASVKKELEDVHGTPTEVYARIVGYYRAVKNWNKGKRDEYSSRKLFTPDCDISDSRGMNSQNLGKIVSEEVTAAQTSLNEAVPYSYEFFMRNTCPNCHPVKDFMASQNIAGTVIDVDTDSGLTQAASKGVFSAPTVIFYDSTGNEIGRGHSVEELKAVLSPLAVVA